MSVVALGRNWIGQWLNLQRAQRVAVNLPAAQSAFQEGDLGSAIEYAQQALNNEPLDPLAYELLIRALIYRSYSEIGREFDSRASAGDQRSRPRQLPAKR